MSDAIDKIVEVINRRGQYECDFGRIARSAKILPKFKGLTKAVNSYHAAQMAMYDLERSKVCIDIILNDYLAMKGHREEIQPEHEGVIGGSLFTEAVICYGRAIFTRNNARYASGIEGKIPREFNRLHARIKELRNEAIAHDGGGSFWRRSSVVVTLYPDSTGYNVPCVSYNYRAEEVQEFSKIVNYLIEICKSIISERADWLEREITKLDGDPDFDRLIAENEFDPLTVHITEKSLADWHSRSSSGSTVLSPSRPDLYKPE